MPTLPDPDTGAAVEALPHPKVLAACKEDIAVLVQAWADRGVSPLEAAMLFSGTGHSMLAQFGFPLSRLLEVAVSMWKKHGGSL